MKTYTEQLREIFEEQLKETGTYNWEILEDIKHLEELEELVKMAKEIKYEK